MSNIKKVHFAEFVLNILDVEFNTADINIDKDGRVIDIDINDMSILMLFSSDMKIVRQFHVMQNGETFYKKRNSPVSALLKDIDEIHSVLNIA